MFSAVLARRPRRKQIMLSTKERTWAETRLEKIRSWEQTTDYEDFIQAANIEETLRSARNPDRGQTLDVIAKARANATRGDLLSPRDVAVLANKTDPELWEAVFETAVEQRHALESQSRMILMFDYAEYVVILTYDELTRKEVEDKLKSLKIKSPFSKLWSTG